MRYLIIVLLFPLSVFAQQGSFVLTGHINSKGKVILYYEDKLDSMAVQEGTFSFKGSISQPSPALLVFQHEGPSGDGGVIDGIFCYIEQGSIELVGKDSLVTATFTAGKVNMEYQELLVQVRPIRLAQRAIFQAYSAVPFKDRTRDGANIARAKYSPTREAEKEVYLQYAHTHPHSLISIAALRRYIWGWRDDAGQADAVFHTLAADVKGSATGKDFQQELQKLLK